MRNVKTRHSELGTPNSAHSALRTSPGFTLIELLVVISIMAVLAGFTIGGLKMAKRMQYIKTASAELAQIGSALENYHDKYNTYPPSSSGNPLLNPLYYELSGTVQSGVNYQTLDGSASIPQATYASTFGGGIVNCTKGSGEDSAAAKNFLSGLHQNRFGTNGAVTILVTSVGGPDQNYLTLLGGSGYSGNPFRYTYPGVNNPKSFDLWIDLSISGKTNRLSNWKSGVQFLP
jgi:prepilin-type N-terminal cleavage/methylation domain-containing protein